MLSASSLVSVMISALAYFDWVFANGAAQASALHYVSLPAKVQAQAKAHWTAALKY